MATDNERVTIVHISNLHCSRYLSPPSFASYLLSLFSSCVQTIEGTLAELIPPPSTVEISIVLQSVKVQHESELPSAAIRNAILNVGFEIVSNSTSDLSETLNRNRPSLLVGTKSKHFQQCKVCQEEARETEKSDQGLLLPSTPFTSPTLTQDVEGPFKVTLSVEGMTCSACRNTITDAVKELPGIAEFVVSLLENSASAVVENEEIAQIIAVAIEDCGFEATIMKIKPIKSIVPISDTSRTVSLRVNGMHCQ